MSSCNKEYVLYPVCRANFRENLYPANICVRTCVGTPKDNNAYRFINGTYRTLLNAIAKTSVNEQIHYFKNKSMKRKRVYVGRVWSPILGTYSL